MYRGPEDLVVEERPVPGVGPEDVLLAVSYCGICGSDLHFVLDGWGHPGSIEGHEFTGRVVAIGERVAGWSVGDAVVGGPLPRCGRCEFCRSGRPSLCQARAPVGESAGDDGAFAEYIRVPAARLLRVPEGVPTRAAALTEPLAVALHGLKQGGVRPGHRLLVTGGGPIGALVVAAARAHGVENVVVSEPTANRRTLVEKLGATAVEPEALITPRSPNLVADHAFDTALDCSGNASAMESALGQLDRGGVLVLVGAGMHPPRFDSNRILLNELVVTGAYEYDADGFDRALELLGNPDFPLDVLIEPSDVDLDGLYDALRSLATGDLAAKVVVAPGARR